MYVVVRRLAGYLVRRGEQRTDIDVETDVREGRCDHLLTTVVTVLPHLGHQNPRAATVGLGKLLDEFGGGNHVAGLSSFVAVNPGDSTDLRLVPPVYLFQCVGDLAYGGLGPGRVDRQRQ